jgi:hypothetical protein
LTNDVETLSHGNDRDQENKHEEHDIAKDLENDINKRRNRVKKRENVDDFDKQ